MATLATHATGTLVEASALSDADLPASGAGFFYLFAVDYRLANLVGIAAGSALNFFAGEVWIFGGGERR